MARIVLPYPPSANRLWSYSRGGVFKSQAARAYHWALAAAWHEANVDKLDGEIAVTLYIYRPRRTGDLDNRVKALLDALNGLAGDDDAQIVELHAYRLDDAANPRVEADIREANMEWLDKLTSLSERDKALIRETWQRVQEVEAFDVEAFIAECEAHQAEVRHGV